MTKPVEMRLILDPKGMKHVRWMHESPDKEIWFDGKGLPFAITHNSLLVAAVLFRYCTDNEISIHVSLSKNCNRVQILKDLYIEFNDHCKKLKSIGIREINATVREDFEVGHKFARLFFFFCKDYMVDSYCIGSKDLVYGRTL